jgi:O-Antigen ligase
MSQIPGYRLPAKLSNVAGKLSLFNGIKLRWSALTHAERYVCACIIATPVWWLVGWTYTLLLITLGMIGYEFWRGTNLQLQRPSGFIISAFAVILYRNASTILRSDEVSNSSLLAIVISLCFCLILWYVESRNIRVRIEVLGWAASVLVLQMFLFWIVAQIVMGAPHFEPPRSLLGQILDKGERFIPGAGSANYLLPYWPNDKLPGGLARFSFFFQVPEDLALVAGFFSLLALDLKKRFWSLPLFGLSVFLLFLSGTRSNWIVLILILALRYLIIVGKTGGPAFLFALVSIISFVCLATPAATELISDAYSQTSAATGSLRQDSTEVRQLIYQRTFEAIVDEPENLLLGRGVTGETVLPGYEPAKIGSHSFILGNLIYRQGLVGTAVFLWFWMSFILVLYRSRSTRPIFCLLMMLYFSLTFVTMEISTINHLLFALITVSRESKPLARSPERLYA